MEKVCSLACFAIGGVFLIIAFAGVWCHLFTVSVCVAAGLLISEDKSEK
jgi:hypothetical protein